VEHTLHVVFLFELVDQRQHFMGLLFRQLGRHLADVLVFGGQRRKATLLESLLHPSEVAELAAHDELGLALLVDAVAHFVETMIHQVELQFIVIDAGRTEAKHPHLSKLEADAAAGAEVAAVLGHHIADMRDSAGRIVCRGFDQQRNAMRPVALVEHFGIGCRVLAERAIDRRLDLVLGHVDRPRVLHDPAQRWIRCRIAAAGLDGHVDVLGDSRELLRHAVPAREHRMLANFEYAAHRRISGTRRAWYPVPQPGA